MQRLGLAFRQGLIGEQIAADRRRLHRRQFFQPGLEAKAGVEILHSGLVHLAQRQGFERRPARHMTIEVAVLHDGDQFARHRQPVQRFAQILASRTLDLVGIGDHAVERAIFGNPFRGGLGPDFFNPGDVVDDIAHQRQVIDDAIRRHAELGQHAGHVELFIAHRVDQADLGRDQLRQILVAGRHHHLMTASRCNASQRADRVVGFDAGNFEDRPAKQGDDLVDRGDLLAQGIGHRRALRLVSRVPGVAESRALGVKNANRMLGVNLLAQALHHRDNAMDRAGRHTPRPAQIGQGMVGTVKVAGTVDQQHDGFAHGRHCPAQRPLPALPA